MRGVVLALRLAGVWSAASSSRRSALLVCKPIFGSRQSCNIGYDRSSGADLHLIALESRRSDID